MKGDVMNHVFRVILLVLICLLSAPVQGLADDLWPAVRLDKVSVAEQAAVIRIPDGRLQMIRAGDVLALDFPGMAGGRELDVIRFEEDLMILESDGEWGRVTWFVSVHGGRQQVSMLEHRPLRKTELFFVGKGGRDTSVVPTGK